MIKGFVLAAGLGTRFKPFTEIQPKPLTPFFDIPMLYIAFEKLLSANIDFVAVNTHHLHTQVSDATKRFPFSKDPFISYEPELLGNGGAYPPLKSWRAGSDILAYSSDVLCDVDLKKVIAQHKQRKPDATLVLLRSNNRTKNHIAVAQGEIVEVRGTQVRHPKIETMGPVSLHDFTSIHILSDRLLNCIAPSGPSDIWKAYQKILSEGGRVDAYFHEGFWADIGSPAEYWRTHAMLMSNSRAEISSLLKNLGITGVLEKFKKHVTWQAGLENTFWQICGANAKVGADVQLANCAIYSDCVLDKGSRVENAVLFNGAHVSSAEPIQNALVTKQHLIRL